MYFPKSVTDRVRAPLEVDSPSTITRMETFHGKLWTKWIVTLVKIIAEFLLDGIRLIPLIQQGWRLDVGRFVEDLKPFLLSVDALLN